MSRLLVNYLQDSRRTEVKLIEQKLVWMNSLQPKRSKRGSRKVGDVRGYDALRSASDSRSHNMPVILIG